MSQYERIKQLSDEKGFRNITHLFGAAGVPRSIATELKMGRTKRLSVGNLMKIAAALGVNMDALVEKDDVVVGPPC